MSVKFEIPGNPEGLVMGASSNNIQYIYFLNTRGNIYKIDRWTPR